MPERPKSRRSARHTQPGDWSAYQRPPEQEIPPAAGYDPYVADPDEAESQWADPMQYDVELPQQSPQHYATQYSRAPARRAPAFYQRPLFIYALLILFPPVGIILLWSFGRRSLLFKALLTLLSAALLAAALWWLLGPQSPFFGGGEAQVQGEVQGESDLPASAINPASFEISDASALAQWSADTSTASANNPLSAYQVVTVPVVGENGAVFGQRAYVEIPKSALQAATPQEFTAYVNTAVLAADYNWFTIVVEPGKGIVFANANLQSANYGVLDDAGRVNAVEGTLARGADGSYTNQPAK